MAAPGQWMATDSSAAEEKTTVVLGTATPGGGFPLYGGVVAEVVNAADPSLSIEPTNTKGSTENVPLLEAGKLDIALVQGEVASEALLGMGRPAANLKIIAAMYSTPGMFVVRADSPYRTIGDLQGRPVAFGARGSGLVILARYVLDGLGLDPDKDFQAIYLDRAGDGPAMVLDHRAAALWGGGIGWPGFTTVAKSGARFIGAERRGIGAHPRQARLPQIHHHCRRQLSGHRRPLNSVGSFSFILARPTLADDVAYRLARALHRGEAALVQKLDQARETTAANTAAAAARQDLIHPGVLRYLREIEVATTQ